PGTTKPRFPEAGEKPLRPSRRPRSRRVGGEANAVHSTGRSALEPAVPGDQAERGRGSARQACRLLLAFAPSAGGDHERSGAPPPGRFFWRPGPTGASPGHGRPDVENGGRGTGQPPSWQETPCAAARGGLGSPLSGCVIWAGEQSDLSRSGGLRTAVQSRSGECSNLAPGDPWNPGRPKPDVLLSRPFTNRAEPRGGRPS